MLFLIPTDSLRAVARWEVVVIPCHVGDEIRPQGSQNPILTLSFLKRSRVPGLEWLMVGSITKCTFHLVDTTCEIDGRIEQTYHTDVLGRQLSTERLSSSQDDVSQL